MGFSIISFVLIVDAGTVKGPGGMHGTILAEKVAPAITVKPGSREILSPAVKGYMHTACYQTS